MIKLPPSTPAQQFGAEATRQIRRLVVKITKVDDSLDLASSERAARASYSFSGKTFLCLLWHDSYSVPAAFARRTGNSIGGHCCGQMSLSENRNFRKKLWRGLTASLESSGWLWMDLPETARKAKDKRGRGYTKGETSQVQEGQAGHLVERVGQ